MSDKTEVKKGFENSILTIFNAAIISALGIIAFYFFNFRAGLSSDHQRWSEFGDFIGGTVGPLVSFFAFFALLLTILLQNKAIRISQEELKLTREELAKTSESAESQARHFITDAKIQDLVESINHVEQTIQSKSGLTLPTFDDREYKPQPRRLAHFLSREMELVSHLSAAQIDTVKDPNLRPEEIGRLFELLFQQLMRLKDIPEAANRYKVLMHRNLETIFLLAQVSALPFDWKAPLDDESKQWVSIYEKALRSYQLASKKKQDK